MNRFTLIAQGIDTLPLMLELARNEALWDRDPFRRVTPDGPHAQMVDIIARYMPLADVTPETRRREHRNVFWPAWHALPSLRPLVFGLMARVQAVELGSILLTRLPPGAEILQHTDLGSWAPEYYHCKAHLTVAGQAVVRCEEDTCVFAAGTIYTFDNLLMHSISNDGDADRICVIISMRCD